MPAHHFIGRPAQPPKGASLIKALGMEGRKYGPLFNDPDYVRQCLRRYMVDDSELLVSHEGALGWTVGQLAQWFYANHYEASGEELDAVCRLIELGQFDTPISDEVKSAPADIVDALIEFQKGPEELSKLVRFKVTGETTPKDDGMPTFHRPPTTPPPPQDGGRGGEDSDGGHDNEPRGQTVQWLKWHELPDGNLKITIVDPDELEELKAKVAAGDTSDRLLGAILEPALTAGLNWLDPSKIGALTDAPILSDADFDEDEAPPVGAKVWWYPDYQIRSPLHDLAERGYTIFQKAPKSD